ncbi:phosphotransferase enzyme family protein [Pedobacter caeni]|uniref:Ser/Thr protein kinase RdoA involved in Cpx stress response, MazF antagonist n=1 Tax=Pedobacter caeni TaxID=288992 RepID=A0A1M4ZZX9_9SPHI|nr:phosphotransferase [Pedobacter caeni]SHF23417.1 Ser/Thr protein kinase RdoA involved in Cpx stress response, MazF antagonist [Pedobacter caeni]
MEKFPVISSILSADHIGLLIAKKYGLVGNVSCTLLKTGINHSYLVEQATGKFVFRLYSLKWRSDLEINEEIRLLNILKERGVPVSFPVKDVNDHYIQYLEAPEGMRQGVLFSFAEGDKLLNFSADLHLKVGEKMAKMHQATHNLKLERVTYTPKVVLEDSFLKLGKFLSADSEEHAWMVSAQQYLLDAINKADVTQLRSGSVHLDIWFDNMNITNDGLITIFDFDFCGNGWLCYDIAYYILQLYSTEKDTSQRDMKVAYFLRGYESVTKITDEERRMLPMLGVSLYFFYLGIQCQRYDNWSNVFLNETYLKRFISLLVRKYFEEKVSELL